MNVLFFKQLFTQSRDDFAEPLLGGLDDPIGERSPFDLHPEILPVLFLPIQGNVVHILLIHGPGNARGRGYGMLKHRLIHERLAEVFSSFGAAGSTFPGFPVEMHEFHRRRGIFNFRAEIFLSHTRKLVPIHGTNLVFLGQGVHLVFAREIEECFFPGIFLLCPGFLEDGLYLGRIGFNLRFVELTIVKDFVHDDLARDRRCLLALGTKKLPGKIVNLLTQEFEIGIHLFNGLPKSGDRLILFLDHFDQPAVLMMRDFSGFLACPRPLKTSVFQPLVQEQKSVSFPVKRLQQFMPRFFHGCQ